MDFLNVFNNLSLRTKLIGLMLILGLVPTALIAFVSITNSQSLINNAAAALDEEIESKLSGLSEVYTQLSNDFFDERYFDFCLLNTHRVHPLLTAISLISPVSVILLD